jgi:hypothetical protein
MLPVNLARLLGPGRARPAFGARSLTIHDPDSGCGIAVNSGKGNRLLTEAGLHRHPLASLGPPARDHRLAALGLHPSSKSVRLRAVTSVRLECALGHETYLLLIQLVGAIMAIGRMRSINDPGQSGKLALCDDRRGSSLHQPRFIAKGFEFADCCTTLAAVTKSLLDRNFSSRFESWRSERSLPKISTKTFFLC